MTYITYTFEQLKKSNLKKFIKFRNAIGIRTEMNCIHVNPKIFLGRDRETSLECNKVCIVGSDSQLLRDFQKCVKMLEEP